MPNTDQQHINHRPHTDENSANKQASFIKVTLAYAPTAGEHYYQQIAVSEGSTLLDALTQAGWLEQFKQLAVWCQQVKTQKTPNAKLWHVGVYSHKQPLDYVLKPYDRIEVYRSLTSDPMGKRKKRAKLKSNR